MTEFQELVKDAPKFVSMERGELVAYAYAMYASGAKMDAENAKLRNEVDNLMDFEHLTSVAVAYAGCDECGEYKQTMLRLFAENAKLRELVKDLYSDMWASGEWLEPYEQRMRKLGIEVDA